MVTPVNATRTLRSGSNRYTEAAPGASSPGSSPPDRTSARSAVREGPGDVGTARPGQVAGQQRAEQPGRRLHDGQITGGAARLGAERDAAQGAEQLEVRGDQRDA